MFSDLYYLSKLIDASFSFSHIEKQNIFNNVKKKPDKIKNAIRVFEDERKGLKFIKQDYQKNFMKIGENLRENLVDIKNKEESKSREKIRNKMNNMKMLEQSEKENEDIDSFINQI